MSTSKNRRAAGKAFRREALARTVTRPVVVVSAKMSPEELRQHLMLGTRARCISGKRSDRRGGRNMVRRSAIDAE